MEIKGFNLWTFLFQMINFFILLFILSRLLYKPLKNIMERRKEEINKCIITAENMKKEAHLLAKSYEEKIEELQKTKDKIIETYIREAEEEKRKIIEKAHHEIQSLMTRERALLQAEQKRLEENFRMESLNWIERFLIKFFTELSLEDIHRLMLQKVVDQIPLYFDQIKKSLPLKDLYNVELCSAFPCRDEELIRLSEKIKEGLSRKITLNFKCEPEILAGIRVNIEGLVVDFSLKGQIKKIRENLEKEI